jgi:hypothetical protein
MLGALSATRPPEFAGTGEMSAPALDLLNVRYCLVDPPSKVPKVPKVSKVPKVPEFPGLQGKKEPQTHPRWREVFSGDRRVYQRRGGLPRAFVAPYHRVCEQREEVLAGLRAEGFDPQAEVLVEYPSPKSEIRNPKSEIRNPKSVPALRWEIYRPNHLRVNARTGAPGTLVFSEVFYPGWRAFIDARPALLLRANGALRAVNLDAGTHRVDLMFQPAADRVGLFMTLAGWAAVCGMGIVTWRKSWLRRKSC